MNSYLSTLYDVTQIEFYSRVGNKGLGLEIHFPVGDVSFMLQLLVATNHECIQSVPSLH